MSDTVLEAALPAAALGQAWALRVLHDTLAPRVVAYLRRHGASEPEDLTSEVFLTVFGRLATVSGGASGLRTFVFSVAHARLVDALRRQARRPEALPYDANADGRATVSAEAEAVAAISAAEVTALIDTLPGAQRDVLLMRLIGDLSVQQVAQALAKSPGAVKQLQRRGLLALQERLVAVEPPVGIEPTTCSLRVSRSAD